MRPLIGTLLLFVAAGCGSSDPKSEGYSAIQSGDWETAAQNFSTALTGLDPAAPDYVELSVARCQALAHTDPDRAKREFVALAGKTTLATKDFTIVVSDLVSEGHHLPAIDILDLGVKTFPEDPKMNQLKDKVVQASQETEDPAVLEKLKGMGYL